MTRKAGDAKERDGGAGRGRRADRRTGATPPSSLARLRGGLTGERSLVGVSYMDDPAMLRAYLDYFWPVSREQARLALESVRRFASTSDFERTRDGAPPSEVPRSSRDAWFRRVIDVGSGPGPVAAAFIDAGATDVTLVDQSERALALARTAIAGRCDRAVSLSTVRADISRPDSSSIPLWGTADCVSFGHCLNELWADSGDRVNKRADLLERYAAALASGGRILVIEPALLSTSRDLLAVRNLLVGRGWSVIAPCPGRARLECPALAAGAQHTCHEEIEWNVPPAVASLARREGVEKDSLKMTWFMFAPPGGRGYGDGTPVGEGVRPVDRAYRVVSDPMLNKGGRVRRLLCGAFGRFPLSAPDGCADAGRTGFDRLRRGDIVSVRNPERRENGWGVDGKTEISVRGEES